MLSFKSIKEYPYHIFVKNC